LNKERLLILTAGTNPYAIASVMTRVREIFDYDKVFILATSASKKDAEEAVKLIESIISDTKINKNKMIDIDVSLMNKLLRESINGHVLNASKKIREEIKKKCGNYKEIYVDVTGGTKLMSSIVMSTTSSLKSGERLHVKVLGPCENVRICLGYLTHLELSSATYSWWSHRLNKNIGYYPKTPRFWKSLGMSMRRLGKNVQRQRTYLNLRQACLSPTSSMEKLLSPS